MGRAVAGEVVRFWLHALEAHDWVGRRGAMVGVSVGQGWSLASAECGQGLNGIGGLRSGVNCIDVLEYASRGTGVDDASFHGDDFVGGSMEFLFSESEVAKCGGAAVIEGAVAGDFSGYARVT
jgi:hypothetical protein